MTQQEEDKAPKLVLTSAKAAATTYSFVTEGEGFKSWALCTVNDQTGELFISSDWGSWSHRWPASPEALGAPTLTAFIGSRSDVDYLACKLQDGWRGGQCFSEQKTVTSLRRLVCERRMAHGREQREYRLEPDDFVNGKPLLHLRDLYTEDGLPIYQDRTVRVPYLTAEAARVLWDEIGETVGECSPNTDLMYDRLLRLSGFSDYVTEEPWEHVMTEQTPEDKALRDVVLPALIQVCKDAMSAAVSADDSNARTEALRAFVTGYTASRPADGPLGHEAEDSFNRWWNDPSVVKARAERQGRK